MSDPIRLSYFGETMLPAGADADAMDVLLDIGRHAVCEGAIGLHAVSETHRAVSCRKCGLRVIVPVGVATYGDLRRFAGGAS